MAVETIKVTKNGITKEILAKDYSDYSARGWVKVSNDINSTIHKYEKVQ